MATLKKMHSIKIWKYLYARLISLKSSTEYVIRRHVYVMKKGLNSKRIIMISRKNLRFSYQVMPRIFCTKSMSSSGTPQFRKMGNAVAMTNKNFASPNRSSKWESKSKQRFHLDGFEFLNAKSLRGTTMAQSGWGIVESSSTFSFLGWWRRNMRHSGSWIAAFGKRHSYSREKKKEKKISFDFKWHWKNVVPSVMLYRWHSFMVNANY